MFNTVHEAQPIFSSESGMDVHHAYRDNLNVSVQDFSLTISNLRLHGLCAGRYICSSVVDGQTLQRSYNLVVSGIYHHHHHHLFTIYSNYVSKYG